MNLIKHVFLLLVQDLNFKYNLGQNYYAPQVRPTRVLTHDLQIMTVASRWHEVYCHDLEVVSLNPGRVELGVRSTSVPSRTWTEHFISLKHLL